MQERYQCGWDSRASLAKDGLDLGIQRFALRCLATHSTETSDAQLLARLLERNTPLLQCALCKRPFASRRGSLAHDLARLALDQRGFRKATHSLRLLALEDCSPGILALRDDAHFFDLHGCLHGWLHRWFRGCLHGFPFGSFHRKSH